jgi:hypothetical protein
MMEWAPSQSVRSLSRADAVFVALGDDVGGAVVLGELLAVRVAAHDSFGSSPPAESPAMTTREGLSPAAPTSHL